MFKLRLKVKILLIMLLGIPAMFGGGGPTRNASASCGRCVFLSHPSGYYGWGCYTSSGYKCLATSNGCTQCASCSCS